MKSERSGPKNKIEWARTERKVVQRERAVSGPNWRLKASNQLSALWIDCFNESPSISNRIPHCHNFNTWIWILNMCLCDYRVDLATVCLAAGPTQRHIEPDVGSTSSSDCRIVINVLVRLVSFMRHFLTKICGPINIKYAAEISGNHWVIYSMEWA